MRSVGGTVFFSLYHLMYDRQVRDVFHCSEDQCRVTGFVPCTGVVQSFPYFFVVEWGTGLPVRLSLQTFVKIKLVSLGRV